MGKHFTEVVYDTKYYSLLKSKLSGGYTLFNKVTKTTEGSVDRFPSAVSQCDVASSLMEEIMERGNDCLNRQ